MNLHKI